MDTALTNSGSALLAASCRPLAEPQAWEINGVRCGKGSHQREAGDVEVPAVVVALVRGPELGDNLTRSGDTNGALRRAGGVEALEADGDHGGRMAEELRASAAVRSVRSTPDSTSVGATTPINYLIGGRVG